MNTKLLNLDWSSDRALFYGHRSTEPTESWKPWCCISEIIPGLFLTCEEQVANRMVSLENGICLIINLCAEEHVAPFKVYERTEGEARPKYRRINSIEDFVQELDQYSLEAPNLEEESRKVYIYNIAAIDAPGYEIDRHFPYTCAFLELVMANRVKATGREPHDPHIPSVAVHCMVGVSRSASVVLAYLMKVTGAGRDETLSFVRGVRPVVNPNPGFQHQLLLWQAADSKRIFDDFSAELVANEVQRGRSVVSYVEHQLPAILKSNKCGGERKYFGYVIAKGLSSSSDIDADAAAIYRELRSFVTAAVDDEVYADSPNFFGYVAEVIASIHRHVPSLLLKSGGETATCGGVWSDVFYYRVTKDIGRSGFVKDTCDTVRAFCSLLGAIHVKHFEELPLSLIPTGGNEQQAQGTAPPEGVCVSFPFTPFIAPYTEGFVQYSELNDLEKTYPTHGEPLEPDAQRSLAKRVARMFLSSFLVSTSGVSSPVISDAKPSEDPAPALEGVDPDGRWVETSRLLFLRDDIEVRAFESLSKSAAPSEGLMDGFVAACRNCEGQFAATSMARKVAAGILSYRLILEAADQFVASAYSDRLPAGHMGVHVSEEMFPTSSVAAFLEALGAVSGGSTNTHKADLQHYFRTELEPLVQCEVVRPEGVWSLLSNSNPPTGSPSSSFQEED